MKTAIITLSEMGAKVGTRLCKALPDSRLFVHTSVTAVERAVRFGHVRKLVEQCFSEYRSLILIAPCGVAVRALAPVIRNKKTDPAVVVVDVGARYAISLLSGHEGGANDLAVTVANILGSEPVVTTTTEAMRNIIVGVGCRRGIQAPVIIDAINRSLKLAGVSLDNVRLIATAGIKSRETGLIEAARRLDRPMRIIPDDDIRKCRLAFSVSTFVQKRTGLPAVAEPAALLAGRRATLVLGKQVYAGTTVALARENFTS